MTDAGKPVVTFGADAPESSRLAYVGPDAYKSGRIGAQILSNYIAKRGVALVISRASEHLQTLDRCRGFMDHVNEYYPAVLPEQLIIDDPRHTYEEVTAAIEEFRPAGIFTTYADSNIVGQALRDLERSDIVLVGFDISEETSALMQEGYVKVLLEQKPDFFSYEALRILFDYMYKGTMPPRITHTDITILTSECLK